MSEFPWQHFYSPSSKSVWKGDKESADDFHHLVQCRDLRKTDTKNSSLALLGFASDEGVRRNEGRPGAVKGPQELRKALGKLPYHLDQSLIDYGNISCEDRDLESAQEALACAVRRLHTMHPLTVLLGGGHEIAWGHYCGIATDPPSPLSILNIDAHFDLRPVEKNQGSSGTSFWQIAKVQTPFHYSCLGLQETSNAKSLFLDAESLKVNYLLESECFSSQKTSSFVMEIIKRKEPIYLTICLDVFSSACAPGVSAPQPFGLLPPHVLPVLKQVAESGFLIAVDIAELAPPFDVQGQTAALAAHLLSYLLHHYRAK